MSFNTTPQELTLWDDVGSYRVKIGMTFTERDGTIWRVKGWRPRSIIAHPEVMAQNVSTGKITDFCPDTVVWLLRDRPHEAKKGL